MIKKVCQQQSSPSRKIISNFLSVQRIFISLVHMAFKSLASVGPPTLLPLLMTSLGKLNFSQHNLMADELAIFVGSSLVVFMKSGQKGTCNGQALSRRSSLAISQTISLLDNSLYSGSGPMPSRFRKPCLQCPQAEPLFKNKFTLK